MYLIYALLSAFFAALVAIFAKLGLKNVDSNLATTVRAIIMALFLSVFVFLINKVNVSELKSIEAKDWILIILSGVAGAISWIFYFLALKSGENNTTQVTAIDRLSLVFVLIFALIFLKEKLELNTVIGVVLITLGAIFVAVK